MAKNKKKSAGRGSNGANLGSEDKLWAAADKMRGSLDAVQTSGQNCTRMPQNKCRVDYVEPHRVAD